MNIYLKFHFQVYHRPTPSYTVAYYMLYKMVKTGQFTTKCKGNKVI